METIDCNKGLLAVSNEVDRATVATILFNQGYSVRKVRKKKNGRSYEYYVYYEKVDQDDWSEIESED